MASTNKTTHYELSQYVSSDKPTYLVDYNGDMAKIDTGINTAKTTADTANTAATNAATAAETAQTTATTAVTNAATAQTSADSANTKIGTLANLNTVEKTNLVGAINEVLGKIADIAYPVGSIYISANNTNPSTLFGGTWVSFGTGRTIVGYDSTQTEFNALEKTGGEKTHTLTIDEMPSHNHPYSDFSAIGPVAAGTGTSAVTDWGDDPIGNTGGGQPHNNLQPYIVVTMWKRTA